MLIEKLRAGTRHTHGELEKQMMPLINGVTDAVSYAKLLHLFYGYYRPLENGINKYLQDAVLADLGERRSSEWILNDLRLLRQSADVDEDGNAPLITSRADALGALYVMEGSTLGGKVICKMIAGNLDETDHLALTFFNGYGEHTGLKWKGFLAVLDRFSDTPEEQEIIEKADEVFVGFREWLKRNIN